MNKDKTIPKLWDNKVDKGGYTGTAQNLKSEIDSKVSKNGDIVTGDLIFNQTSSSIPNVVMTYDNNSVGSVRGIIYKNYKNVPQESYSAIGAVTQDGNIKKLIVSHGEKVWEKETGLIVNSDNTCKLYSNNLTTKSKETVSAINELNDNKLTKTTKIGKHTSLQKQGMYSGTVGIYVGGNNGIDFSVDETKSIYFGYDTFGDNPVETYKFCNGDGKGTLGNVYVGNIYNSSDLKLKTNIKPLDNVLEKIKNINGYTYNFKNDKSKKPNIGLIAQEVVKEFPELVNKDEKTELMSINYVNISAVLLEAIKEQQKIIDDLNERLISLENKVNKQ